MFGLICFVLVGLALIFASKAGAKMRKAALLAAKSEDQGGRSRRGSDSSESPFSFLQNGGVSLACLVLGVVFILLGILKTSFIYVPTGKFAVLNRTWVGTSLEPGQIVAKRGQIGPQSRILTAGINWELFITLTHDYRFEEVFQVPVGQCAIVSAKDGLPASSGSPFAAPWSETDRMRMVNDAEYFLGDGKGVRGPQTTVLTTGFYTINPNLWEKPRLIPMTRVEQGTVGVVKSSVQSAVDFGSFKREAPKSSQLKVLTNLPKGAAGAVLVPVGAVGVWEEPLPNGLYNINTEAYRITMVPTVAQVYEYRGGYKYRKADVTKSDKGAYIETFVDVDVPVVQGAADTAILTRPEGWDVWQEARVIAQVSPDTAPFVVAALGLTQENASQIIEDRVVTPILRSVTREVLGGAQIPFKYQKAILDKDGKTVMDEQGQPKTEMASEFRAVKVLDLLEQRGPIEEAIEQKAKPEALKEGVMINEIRLAESAIPGGLLSARKREQLAQQDMKALQQEELAQKQRQLTENARAQAEQQTELVKAEIAAKAAKQRAEARKIEGEGEQQYLTAVAMGQKAQSEILGQETTAKLQMFQQLLKTAQDVIEKHPDLLAKALENSHKFVPSVVVNGAGGTGGGLEGPAAIFGHLMNSKEAPAPKPAKPTNSQVSIPRDVK